MRMMALEGLERFLQYPLARNKVHYVGEPVAIAIAESRYLAEDALDAIEVAYEPLPAVVDMRESLKDEVIIHEDAGTNLAARFTFSIGDVEEAFSKAEYTRKEEFRTHRHTGVPMENRGLVATYDSATGDLTVWGPTKVIHFNRRVLSSLLEIPEEKIRFIEPDVGGGFGIRGEFYPEDFLIPFAAIKLGRPVKWIEDRREHLMAANHSRGMLWEVEIAAKRDGTILGMRARLLADIGAYARTHGGLVPSHAARWLPGPYRISNYTCEVNFLITNKMGIGTYRAPGSYESSFARERLMDMVAADLQIEPAELRLKNLIQPSDMPYDIGMDGPTGEPMVYDSGDFPSAFRQALEKMDYAGIKALQGKEEEGKYNGIGIATFVKLSGLGPYETARVVVREMEDIRVYVGIASLGQGHETVMAQICSDALGVPMAGVKVFHGDTDLIPDGVGTYGGRTTIMAGSAIHLACQKLKGRIFDIASAHLEIPSADLELREGRIYRNGAADSEPLLDLDEVVELARQSGDMDDRESGIVEAVKFDSDAIAYPYGTHLAHVTVDPETGLIDILRYVTAHDVGRCINPLLVQGQIIGAIVQGIGGTILEDLVYDENGQLLTTTFMDYLLPLSTDVPPIDSIILEEAPSPRNPLGVKGAGELGIVCPGAVIANAVSHALGVEVKELPLSPDRVRALARKKG